MVVSPTSSSSIGLDYYRIKQDGVIGTESATTTLANEASAPQKITRDADGRITTLYRQYRNQGQREVSGIDLDLRQRFVDQEWGKLTLAGQLSRVLRFAEPLSDGAPLTNGAGTNYFGSIPKWRGVTSATWEQGKWSSTLTWNYVGTYREKLTLMFREQTGMTVFAFIREARIARGVALLQQTDIDVQDVALLIGFHNAGNFATAFRERMGMTPSAYRQRLQEQTGQRQVSNGH